MVEEEIAEADGELPLEGVGQKLRRAREKQGLKLAQMGERTRISQRHLELIEDGEFAALPARTYAIGFTRTYARELGLDENRLVDELRQELAEGGGHRQAYTPAFEPGDPAKVPPAALVWASLIAVVLLAIGVYAFYSRFFAAGADPAPLVAEAEQAAPAGMSNPAQGSGVAAPTVPTANRDEVVFTALEDGVWVSFYEAGGRRLEQKLMAKGESFAVPSDATDPRIWTGRPDAFAITVGGQPVAKLAEEQVVIRDVAIAAEALRARQPAQQTGGTPPAVAPARNPATTG
ncbi:DUF4115 domain-containing protein [Altererythrobacter sp. BO-6]|uniref:helix-turn-helix domain-containing protein n=1 Tax=Altererythrobacter sp. BO-6 TaxID=2604537 RepID=UPI0013E1A6EE|nr:helix-turn-helix domain-containing protein [Altererythrobacter sp. BO-6]QIG54659.1 DUF4115 domain-containing protein [Altererythrobacter sp. BO-6]